MAVQLAKLCGYKVITTATPKNHEFLRGIGADFVVDYHDGEKAVREIVKYSEGKLALAYEFVAFAFGFPSFVTVGCD